MPFSLIHVSDLHFRRDHPSLERLHLLRDDILAHAATGPLYLAFSGDLVDAGDDDLYSVLLDEFFIELHDRLAGIYLVPGNHDIQRSQTSAAACSAILDDNTFSYLYKPTNTLHLSNPFVSINPLENFNFFNELISSYQDINYFGSFDSNEHFSIACINSTWLSLRRAQGTSDSGFLRIDPPVLNFLCQKLSPDTLNICMFHHPLDWLDHRSRQQIENLLTTHFDVVLFGHMHNPTTLSGMFNSGQCLFLQAPAVKSASSFGNNAYTIINIDGIHKKFEILYRSFSKPRNCFISGAEFAKNGLRYPTQEDETHWRHIRTRTSSGLLARFKEEIRHTDFRDWYHNHFVAKTRLSHKFIVPSVARVKYQDGERSTTPPEKLTAAIDCNTDRQFVLGPQDSGLTTAAFITAEHMSRTVGDFGCIPVYVNLAEIQVNRATLITQAMRTSPVRYTRSEIETLAESGDIFFIFDQVGLPESKRLNEVIATMERYFPLCKVLFFCAVDGGLLKEEEADDIVINPLTDSVLELQELDVLEISELIRGQRAPGPAGEQTALLRNVVNSFKQMNEPVYPSVVTLLLETLRQIPEFRPINRARLIDRYVECLLGRLEWEDVTEGVFNSSDKVNFLSYLAGYFAIRHLSTISSQTWREIVEGYAKSRLLELPANLLEEFTQKGILIRQNGVITFRADYLFTYFVAKEMNRSSEVYEFVTAEEAFFVNFRELVFYGELEGVDNARLLSDTHDKLEVLEGEALAAYQAAGVSLADEWEGMRSENAVDDQSRLSEAVDKAVSEAPTEETESRALTDDLKSVERTRGVVQRASVRETEARWLVALRTYLQLIKHSGGLAGEEKLRHLRRAVGSAELFMKSLASKRDEISRRPMYFHSGIIYLNPLAKTDPERARREFKFLAPTSLARLINECMNNTQLAPAFRELLRDESEVSRFIARYLLLDIPGAENRRAFVRSLEESDDIVLQTCSLRRLKYKYLGYSVSGSSRAYYEGIIQDIAQSGSLRGAIGRDQLKKERLLVDMRRQSKERMASKTALSDPE